MYAAMLQNKCSIAAFVIYTLCVKFYVMSLDSMPFWIIETFAPAEKMVQVTDINYE